MVKLALTPAFLAIFISIFNIFKYYFYTSFCAFSESIDGF